jgi:Lrp/AsnC family transcriptional regulator, cysteine-sensing transcriptional activator
MAQDIDNFDRAILTCLQEDASSGVEAIAEKVKLSRNACWRRIRLLEERGIITRRVALVDPEKIGLELSVIVLIRTDSHDPEWLARFRSVVRDLPQIQGAYRIAGEVDYALRVRVKSVKDYDVFYQQLIRRVPVADVSASFVMEEIKETTALPV